MQTFLNKAPGKSITLPSDIIVRKGKTWSDVHQWENSFIREWRKIVQLECDYWKNTTFLHSTALHSVASLDGQENAVFFHPWIFTHRFLLHCNYIIMFLLLLFCSVNWIKCKIENARLRSGSFLEMVFKNSCRIQLNFHSRATVLNLPNATTLKKSSSWLPHMRFKIIFVVIHKCNFAPIINHNINICIFQFPYVIPVKSDSPSKWSDPTDWDPLL